MEINAGIVGTSATVLGVLSTVFGTILRDAFRSRDEKIAAMRATQVVLFEKLDVVRKESEDKILDVSVRLQNYKLHVAETYVNQAALEKLLDPIQRRLDAIETDLRNARLKP